MESGFPLLVFPFNTQACEREGEIGFEVGKTFRYCQRSLSIN